MDKYQSLFGMLCDLNGPPVISEMNDIIQTVKRQFLWKPTTELFDPSGALKNPVGRSLILWDDQKQRIRTGNDLTAFGNWKRFTHYIDILELGRP